MNKNICTITDKPAWKRPCFAVSSWLLEGILTGYFFPLQNKVLFVKRVVWHPSVNIPVFLFIHSITPPLISIELRPPSFHLHLEDPWVTIVISPVVQAFLQLLRMRPRWSVCLLMRYLGRMNKAIIVFNYWLAWCILTWVEVDGEWKGGIRVCKKGK